jgi:hypothetical protein
VARIELWNGDICDLEVDAIVSPAATSLWMSTGIAGEIKRVGGDEIEFAAIRQAPVALGDAVVTPAGRLAAKVVVHAVSLERDRRTSRDAIERAARSAMARVRELSLSSVAFGLGGVGGFRRGGGPDRRRDARAPCPSSLGTPSSRWARGHEAFAPRSAGEPALRPVRLQVPGGPSARAMGPRKGARGTRIIGSLTRSSDGTVDERRAKCEVVAREIRLRGLTGPAVHFLEASRPYRPLGAPAMLFFDPVLRDLFGGELPSASELLRDDLGIEALIDRLEELDEADGWDA